MTSETSLARRARSYLATLFSSRRRTVQALIGVLTLLKLLTYVPWAVHSFVRFPVNTLFSLIGLIILLLLLSGSLGVYSLLRDRPRGFIAYYIYGFVATFGMASFVTLFPTGLFARGVDIRLVNVVLIVYNLMVCLLVAALQVRAFRARVSNNAS